VSKKDDLIEKYSPIIENLKANDVLLGQYSDFDKIRIADTFKVVGAQGMNYQGQVYVEEFDAIIAGVTFSFSQYDIIMYEITDNHKVLARRSNAHLERIIHIRWVESHRYIISGSYDKTCKISYLTKCGTKILGLRDLRGHVSVIKNIVTFER